MKKSIVNGKVILEDRLADKVIIIENGKIIDIADEPALDSEIINANGLYVSPGLLDVHIHGNDGFDVMDGTFEALNRISKSILRRGVTSFLPTTLTQSFKKTYQAVKNVKENAHLLEGAQAVGVHLEGPFFDNKFKGAQPEQYIALPSVENYKDFTKDCEDVIKMISLAPEKEGAKELIKYVVSQGVVASIGHTSSTYQQAIEGFDAGITHATHTYNGMTGFNHREPGVVGAIFDDNRIYAELILDGIHVHFASARALMKIKGKEKVVLVTDCMMAGNLPDGQYDLGGQPVQVKDRAARLENGALAGSTLNLDEAVKNAYHNLGLSIVEAVNLASLNPARNLKMDDIGSITIGKKANLVFFDEAIDVQKVFVEGELKYQA